MMEGRFTAFARDPDESASSNGDGETFGSHEINIGRHEFLKCKVNIYAVDIGAAKLIVYGTDQLGDQGHVFTEITTEEDVVLEFTRPFKYLGFMAEGVGVIGDNDARWVRLNYAVTGA